MKRTLKIFIVLLLASLAMFAFTGCSKNHAISGIKVEDNVLKWNVVENAKEYRVQYGDNEKTSGTRTELDLVLLDLAGGNHTVTVKAIIDDKTTKSEDYLITVSGDVITGKYPSSKDGIQNWFAGTFTNPFVATFLIGVLPIVELRGAIPFGYLYFQSQGFTLWQAFLMGYLGSSIIVPILLLVLVPIINWLKKTKLFKKLALWVENKFAKKSLKVEEKANANADALGEEVSAEKRQKKILWSKIIGVATFVAIPLPFTGAWTGSAVAAFMKMEFKHALPAILIGNLIAGTIITLISGFTGIFI